ncbi:uncharacterized protein LOC142775075 isoform X3 [Rhipicephalus microplus]|uniref:uncharacterized protein LOC142775075 isoform X3 n=1 Tax=Rhipicephalus microplus TaxID=6941 RepID=UPI003F6C2057
MCASEIQAKTSRPGLLAQRRRGGATSEHAPAKMASRLEAPWRLPLPASWPRPAREDRSCAVVASHCCVVAICEQNAASCPRVTRFPSTHTAA